MTYEKLDNDELLRIALDAVNHDRHADAVGLLKTLLERDPRHVFGTYLLAAEHAQIGMMDRAEEGFARTLALAPEFPMARFQLGQMLLLRGRAEAARETLAPLAQLPAGQALPHYARGLVAASEEDAAGAIAHLRAGLACPQEIPALAADMRRVIDNLQAIAGGAPPAPVAPAPSAASLFLSGYGKSRN